jgi:hypothetical protein
MTTEELMRVLQGYREEDRVARHDANAHMVECINDLRLKSNSTDATLELLEKNLVELKGITLNQEKLMEYTTKELTSKVDDNKANIIKYYESPVYQQYGINEKRITDVESNQASLKKVDRAQDIILEKHGRWFFAGWVLFLATQVVLKYLPIFSSSS